MKNNKLSVTVSIAILLLIMSCKHNEKKAIPVRKKAPLKEKKITPIFGYRFAIQGDFDGDGKQEKLTEHYINRDDGKESNKYYDGVDDYYDMVDLVIKKNPESFALSDDPKIDMLQINSGGQLFGISYLKNEGDLNGDGTDEVSYVIDYADFSNLNSWHIVTYKNKEWEEIYKFSIWDSQLPNLPSCTNQYGLFGTENKIIETSEDKATEKKLHEWKGLVKKLKHNKIQVIYRTDEAEEDTIVVDFKHLPTKQQN